jgi:predicted ATPase
MAANQERSARAQFQELTRILDQELGAEPSPEIRALLRRDTRPVRPLPDPVARAGSVAVGGERSDGEFKEAGAGAPFRRPRDRDEAPSAARAIGPIGPIGPPAEKGTPAPRTVVHLPLALTRFFGREQEVSEIGDALGQDARRLLTLTGPGGTGKTRLAIEAARRFVSAFPGGIWFVPLADLQDADRFFEVLGKALGLPPGAAGDQERRVVGALEEKAAAGRMLLILDNFEHVVDSCAGHVTTLLNRVPPLSFLVTSRQRLSLDGEQELPVRPLPTPAHPGTPDLLLEFPSVQLFVNRAQAARSDFQITGRNAEAVAKLCARLEGIPLAIELSAAWSRTLTPAQMLERLTHRFELLVSRRRDISERQSTLRATIEWSYRLLPTDLQAFFAGLSLFRGGWTLEAAEAVSSEPRAMAFLAELCERSLILADETVSGGMRYRMLESMREFAQERLPEAEAADLRQRYLDYFLAFAETGAAEISGPQQSDWLNRLDEDQDNFRSLLARFAGSVSEADQESHLRLTATLSRFWLVRGYLTEGRQHLAAALDRTRSAPAPLRVLALAAAGNLAGAQGDRAAAQRHLEACRDQSREIDDTAGLSQARSGLGNLAMHRGSFDEAKRLYEEALLLHRQRGNTHGAARTLMMLGNLAGNQADLAAARRFYDESLALNRQVQDQSGIAHVYQNLGVITARDGDLPGALRCYEKSLDIRRELNDLPGLAATLETLGTTSRKLGDPAAAARYYDESLALRHRMQDRAGAMLLRLNLALAAIDRGDSAGAAAQVRESLALIQESGNDRYLPYVLETYASVAVLRKEYERAARLWGAAETLRAELKAPGTASEIAERAAQIEDASRAIPAEQFTAAFAAGRAMGREAAPALVRD